MLPNTASVSVQLELCAGGIDDVVAGAQMGVDRIELNTGMPSGGLTPSAGLAIAARKIFPGPLIAMVRPREGGFCYSESEFQVMLDDSHRLLELGMDGLATGFLSSEGTIQIRRCEELRRRYPKATLVFHKAFDVSKNLEESLQQLIDCGFDRILTSGGARCVNEGAQAIRNLLERSSGRIEILPGGGVRAENVRSILQQTGCSQVHAAVRKTTNDPSMSLNCALHYGIPGDTPGSFGQTDPIALSALIKVLRTL